MAPVRPGTAACCHPSLGGMGLSVAVHEGVGHTSPLLMPWPCTQQSACWLPLGNLTGVWLLIQKLCACLTLVDLAGDVLSLSAIMQAMPAPVMSNIGWDHETLLSQSTGTLRANCRRGDLQQVVLLSALPPGTACAGAWPGISPP